MKTAIRVNRVVDERFNAFLSALNEKTHGSIHSLDNKVQVKYLHWDIFRHMEDDNTITIPTDQNGGFLPSSLEFVCTKQLHEGRKLFAWVKFIGTTMTLLFPAMVIDAAQAPAAFTDMSGNEIVLANNERCKFIRILNAPASDPDNTELNIIYSAFDEAVYLSTLRNPATGEVMYDYVVIRNICSHMTLGTTNEQELYGLG